MGQGRNHKVIKTFGAKSKQKHDIPQLMDEAEVRLRGKFIIVSTHVRKEEMH